MISSGVPSTRNDMLLASDGASARDQEGLTRTLALSTKAFAFGVTGILSHVLHWNM